MQKVKHTKSELKRQKDALKGFLRYLPTLTLKKQQLQREIVRILHVREELESDIENKKNGISEWVAAFGEDVQLEKIIKFKKTYIKEGNIAGIDIPLYDRIEFDEEQYEMLNYPLWVDRGIEAVKEMTELKIRLRILDKQLELLREELRITTQRVNLFEKVKIPESRENIRRISIFLGDLQTASVITGKIAKGKILKKVEVEALA